MPTGAARVFFPPTQDCWLLTVSIFPGISPTVGKSVVNPHEKKIIQELRNEGEIIEKKKVTYVGLGCLLMRLGHKEAVNQASLVALL